MPNTMRRICVVPGDGIGPEVIEEGVRFLRELDQKCSLHLDLVQKDWGADKWLKEGVGLPKDALADLEANFQAIYFGAVGDPRIPDTAHGREILLGLRFGLDLYANVRPAQLLDDRLGILSRHKKEDIDFVVVRENTEDAYVSMGGRFKQGTADEIAIDEAIHTKKGVHRIITYAFELAKALGKSRVSLADKSNAIRYSGLLWQETFKSVAAHYPSIASDHMFVDAMAMELVQNPARFGVIVASNLFGDILSDLAAAIAGGIGLAASANLHPGKIGLFEPVHGAANTLANTGKANPMAALQTAVMMLTHLGIKNLETPFKEAMQIAFVEGFTTPDLGGTCSTRQVSDFIRNKMMQQLQA